MTEPDDISYNYSRGLSTRLPPPPALKCSLLSRLLEAYLCPHLQALTLVGDGLGVVVMASGSGKREQLMEKLLVRHQNPTE